MNDAIHLVGLCGSLRKASFNRALLAAAAELLPTGVTLEVAEIGDFPLYNEDLERAAYPPAVTRVRAQIAAADAVLIATPEYNYGVPGVLKNAIDWISRPQKDAPWRGKALAIAGASPGGFGAVRGIYQMRQIAVSQDMHVLNRPEIMVSAAQTRFDEQGRLTDETTRKYLSDMLEALAEYARQLRRS